MSSVLHPTPSPMQLRDELERLVLSELLGRLGIPMKSSTSVAFVIVMARLGIPMKSSTSVAFVIVISWEHLPQQSSDQRLNDLTTRRRVTRRPIRPR